MSYLQTVFLGILQGLTEFLPVSSSGHLAIAQNLMPGFKQPGVLLEVLLHAGTMFAVMVYFRKELLRLIQAPFLKTEQSRVDRRILLLLIAASIPTAIIGLAFKDFFEGLFHNLTAVSAMLLVTGSLLYFTENREWGQRTEGKMTLSDALAVGLAQGAAIIPGISRSGATIACLLLRGLDNATAARFSFLLALPAVGGATLLSLRDLEGVPTEQLPMYGAGMLASFITGLLAIGMLMAVVRQRRLRWFAVYCWLIGGAFLVLSLQ